jgi:hypothetical protein
MMKFDINSRQREILNHRFPDSKKVEARGDILFVYSDEFQGDIYETANARQAAVDFLKYVTCRNPTQFFNSRVMVGHNKIATQANWSGEKGNRIHIPWKDEYLKQGRFLHSCSHEIVHPFYRLSPLHKSNEKWGDAFCEFLRGPCKKVIGQDGKRWWLENVEQHQNKGKNTYRNVAGQILTYAKRRYYNNETMKFCISEFIDDKEKMKEFMNHLFEQYRTKSLCEIFTPVDKMKI